MIALGPLLSQDLRTLQAWRNGAAVRAHVRETRFLTDLDQQRWWEWLHGAGAATTRMFGVRRVEAPDWLVGCAGLTGIDWVNRRAELSVYAEEPDEWAGEPIEVLAARLVIAYGLEVLGLHRIEAETITDARAALCRALDMREEGTARHRYWRNGAWVDSRRFAWVAAE